MQEARRSWRAIAATLLLSCALILRLSAQWGNEWINYDQRYWKFPIAENGLTRIPYAALANAGFINGNTDWNKLQVFARGREQYVSFVDNGDGIFAAGDYIELIVYKNDAWLDSVTYDQPSHLANPAYSLFNDTIHYFLTQGTENGLRTAWNFSSEYLSYTSSAYGWYHAFSEFHDTYLIGDQDINGISLPWYEKAEGWFAPRFPKGGSHQANVPTPFAYVAPDDPPVTITTHSASASLAAGFPNHHLQVGFGSPLLVMVDTVYYGYQLNQLSFAVPSSALGASNTPIVHRSVDDLGVAADWHAVSYVAIDYPRQWKWNNEAWWEMKVVNPLNADHVRLDIENISSSSARLWVKGNGAVSECQVIWENGIAHALVPFSPNESEKKIIILEPNDYSVVNELMPVSPSGFFTKFYSNPVDSAFVILTHSSLRNAANNYAAYRSNEGMNVLTVNVDDLYDQYAYGIEKHPLAIRGLLNQLLSTWPSDPSHLFIIGKSIHEMSISSAVGARNDDVYYAQNLVPTWGWPCSDIALTAGLNGTLHEAAIPTGRLAAKNEQEVLDYLNKVVEKENAPPAAWQKNILHFGGGSVTYEQNLFSGYLNTYRSIAQDTSYAASVYTFLKSSSDPIQMNVSDSIRLLINEGAALMTFFGHASSTGFDQNIDSPQDYENQGKYPFLIGNSCYTGNIHLEESQSASEQFVLAPNRGVIGFIAKSDLGIPSYLDMFTHNLYLNLFKENYGESVGQCIQQAVRDFQSAGEFYKENVALTFALHGDPALRLYTWEKPDFTITSSDITFSPALVTAQVDSFDVKIALHNIGKATGEDVQIELVRHFPNGVDSSYVRLLDHIYNTDTALFTLPIDPLIGVGENQFDVRIDLPAGLVDELDDLSNNAVYGKTLLISAGDLIPVYPYPYAVVPNNQIRLKASTGFALEPMRTYRIQVDTSEYFTSSSLIETTVTSSGGVIEWDLPLILVDSTVYYWRCSADSLGSQDQWNWRVSSFQYITDKTGFGQSHPGQFVPNDRSGISYNRSTNTWSFSPLSAELKCEVYGNANTSFEQLGTRYQIDLEVQDYSGAGNTPALIVAVLDGASLEAWKSNYAGQYPQYDFGNTLVSANARQRPERYFIFQQDDPAQLSGLASMITNAFSGNEYLLIYSWKYANKEIWPAELLSAFTVIGAEEIVGVQDSMPFIYFKKLDDLGSEQFTSGSNQDAYLVMNAPLEGSINSGEERALVFGKLQSFQEASWRFANQDLSDSLSLIMRGITPDQVSIPVALWNEMSNSVDVSTLLNPLQFEAAQYIARIADTVENIPVQLQRWHVLGEEVTELAWAANEFFQLSEDTLQVGEEFRCLLALKNISATPSDSVLIRYDLINSLNQTQELNLHRIKPLEPGEVYVDTLLWTVNTSAGTQQFFAEINPASEGIFDQREQFHFNNLLQLALHTQTDQTNPMLDVTFDGIHILDGDLVSATPTIVMCLDDDNPYLLLNSIADTVSYRIFLAQPGGELRPLYFADEAMSFVPASNEQNKSKVVYTPTYTVDGRYTLQVQAKDRSGNYSADQEYRVDFEVETASTISEVFNYPNPFSTSTRFLFTLSGSEVPDEMKIQIMNISGDIVREIMADELGIMRIGRNLTEYAWDGRDEFGDPLANGVYLYRVIARLRGKELEFKSRGGAEFFQKGFGKMYIMR